LLNKNIALAAQDNAELTQKLISSNRALGVSALANTLTHQLSQPITGIAIQAEIAQRDIPKTKENEASIKILERIGTETNKLSELVNNLRSLFTRGGCDFKKRQLSSTCETVVNLYNPTFTSSQVSFDVDYKANPLVNINEIQIQQVLINTLNNALEAVRQNTSQARRISLQLSKDDSDAVILITDSGSGVAPELQNELFELYKTTKSNGMGVGLWLSKTIIDQHNGSISIYSSTGIGTTVEIRLPLAH
jgi:C4-dicarboxylate-specific signal transduction histidine kinase